MFKFVVLAIAVTSVYGYGSVPAVAFSTKTAGGLGISGLGISGLGVSGLGLGVKSAIATPVAISTPLAISTPVIAGGYGYARQAVGPIVAAVHSTRSYSVVPVASHFEAPIAQTIDIPPNVQPINMIFRTQSSPLNLQQIHTPTAPQHQSTRSEDAPSVLTHENYKPVIQEFKEVIQPFRKIEQRIQPVIEHVHTVVSKGEEVATPVEVAAPVESVELAAPVERIAFTAPVERVAFASPVQRVALATPVKRVKALTTPVVEQIALDKEY